jgi:2-polyprenyl-3-methyl-5-hydroxy-6-metoxy-1,4-benzoquinol methylase
LKPSSPRRTGHLQGSKDLFEKGLQYQRARQLKEAVLAYKRALRLDPAYAEAANSLGGVLLLQGRLRQASAAFARSLELAPQLFDDFRPICATLAAVLPEFGDVVQRVRSLWPARPQLEDLFAGAAFASIASDPLLLTILRSTPIRDIDFERTLVAIRAGLLKTAMEGEKADPVTLGFCAALAQQCFINEYVFAMTPTEQQYVNRMASTLADGALAHARISPLKLAILAMYRPLYRLPNADALLKAKWPAAFEPVLTQQLLEPRRERELRGEISILTPIANDVSNRVRQQYEENPYPRWVSLARCTEPLAFLDYLKTAVLGDVPQNEFVDILDVLVAGCGTGSHPIELARKLRGSRVLAVDLSLSSLAYARRKTPADVSARIEYAQADILQLSGLGRSFNVIDASGVLHHMAEPEVGLRVLLSLLRPGGFLHLGLYSQIARRDVQRAREYLAAQRFGPTVEDIRRAREALLNSDLRTVAQSNDFYTTSECRDLLFHVQEHQITIPHIKALVEANRLIFVGFSFDPVSSRKYAELFAQAGKRLSDLNAWHEFEQDHPATFRGMYQFWVRKNN